MLKRFQQETVEWPGAGHLTFDEVCKSTACQLLYHGKSEQATGSCSGPSISSGTDSSSSSSS